jgi:UPF0755 protein
MRRLSLLLIAVLLVAGWAVAPWYVGSGGGNPVQVTVTKGASLSSVAVQLERASLVSSASQFKLLARLLGGSAAVQAGTYRLEPGQGWRRYLKALQSGEVQRFAITIPEGWPSIMVAERLRAEPDLSGPVAVPAEGSVLPETYAFTPGEPRAAVLKRMQAAMSKALASLWAARQPQAVVKTPQEAVILASIVEKETGKPSERPMVAGVYSNRIRIGMKLDADPTLIYPITAGKALGRRIRLSEKNRDTGYNTYLKPGLPKGPIANPGRASIAAVLDPVRTDALYFVADGSGGHVFARTLAEQNANRQRWFALRRQRGEM